LAPTLVFDIETVPDIDGLRKLHELGSELSPADIAEMAFQSRRQVTGNDFLQLHLHKIIAISCVLRRLSSVVATGLAGVSAMRRINASAAS
jgi:predicted PolB exonuclease-like 3'-5' exonuclease